MVSDTKWKVILMEECHIFLSSDKWRKALETMVRHSRHYNTIIMNVSQNVDDFLKTANASIALNSNHIFLFRTRKLGEADLLPLKLDGFDGIRPAALVGGSGFPYSECYHSDGKYCRKLRIIE
jgi:DNA helicase HerA-like ATPase